MSDLNEQMLARLNALETALKDARTEFQGQLNEKDDQIERLSTKLQRQIDENDVQIERLGTELREQLDGQDVEIEKLGKRVCELKDYLRSIDPHANPEDDEDNPLYRPRYETDFAEMKQQFELLKTTANTTAYSVAKKSASKEVEKLRGENETLKKQVTNLERSLKMTGDEFQEKVASVETRVDGFSNKFEDISAKLDGIQTIVKHCSSTIEREGLGSDLRGRFEQLEIGLIDQNKHLQRVHNRLMDLESSQQRTNLPMHAQVQAQNTSSSYQPINPAATNQQTHTYGQTFPEQNDKPMVETSAEELKHMMDTVSAISQLEYLHS